MPWDIREIALVVVEILLAVYIKPWNKTQKSTDFERMMLMNRTMVQTWSIGLTSASTCYRKELIICPTMH